MKNHTVGYGPIKDGKDKYTRNPINISISEQI